MLYNKGNLLPALLTALTESKSCRSILIAILACAAASCAKAPPDPAQLRSDEIHLIRQTVTDPARAQRLLALLDARDQLLGETVAMMRQYRRELGSLNRDYDASRDVVVEIIDYYNRERAQKQLRFIELIARMKRETTAEEWAVIADFELDNFNPRRLIYQRLPGGA